MVVAVETVVVQALNIATGVPVPVAIPIFTKEDVEVTYGIDGLPTVQNVDYTVEQLDEQNFDTFIITPLAALLTKINNLIAADPNEINAIYIRRKLDYKTSSTADAVKNTPYTSKEFDRTAARFQQQNEEIKRSIKFVKSVTSGDELAVRPLTPNRVPVISADGNFLEDGPTADQIENAQAYANAASVSAAAALTSQNGAATSASDALTSKNKAQQWASNPEDDDVEPGLFSALHWAKKAESSALPAPIAADTVSQPHVKRDTTGYENIRGMLNVLSFIPSVHRSGIRDRTITTDLTTYLQDALTVSGERGEFLFWPGGRYPHASALVYGPQPTSYTPSGDDTTSDLHFMQMAQAQMRGVGFAELYALAAMGAQMTVTYQNGKQAPHGSRIEGMFFNGRSLAGFGVQALWTFNMAFVNNRFDAHVQWNFDQEGRAHFRLEQNIFRNQKCVRSRLGGDNYFSGNDFYVKGAAGSVRRCIEFGPSSGNTIVGKGNVFTLEAGFNPDNTNAQAIYIDGISTYMATTGNRDFQIDGCEFHGFEYGVLAEGSSGTNLKNIDIINCHSFTGAQSKTTLAKVNTARAVNIINNRSNTNDTTRSTTPGIVLNAVENAEISHNQIRGVTGVEAIQITGNCIDVNVHDNHFLEAVNTAHAYILVDGSSLVSIHDNHAQQYSAFTTKFVREVGAGSGSVYGNNHLSASFTDPYDVANTNTTYRGADYSGASQGTVAAGATVYIGDNGSQSAEYLAAWMNPSRAKYAKRLAVQVNTAPGAGQTFTYTLNVDGVDTALTCQISGAGVFTSLDIDNEALISTGSRFAVKLVTSAGAAVTAHRVSTTLV